MTDTQQMNGPAGGDRYIDTIDPDDPEYIRQMRRPAEVKEDVKQMEQRSRVSLILKSQAFKEELEALIQEQLAEGNHPASLLALQQISELLPRYRFNQSTGGLGSGLSGGTVIPIADIRGVDALNYSKGEKMLRCKLASLYRLCDLYGWSNGINNHITCRISQEHEHFLISPYGMLYQEVTGSALVKADMQGEIVDAGATTLGIHKNGFALHSAIHAFRPDVRCIIHLHTPAAVAVSTMKCGLLPICQEAMVVGEASYFDYMGVLTNQDERDELARALGPNNRILFLRNHGVVACGESVEEAFSIARNLTSACETQVKTMPIGLDNIIIPSEEVRRQTYDNYQKLVIGDGGESKRKWRKGEMEFEGLMRYLDNAGYRTGHVYHEPIIKRDQRPSRINDDVEIPPSATSTGYWDDDKFSSPLKQTLDRHKKQFRTDWLASPNAYKKEEIEETGTPNPKKITKWVDDKDGGRGQANIRIEDRNQFAPLGANPKELREKHKEIRKEYYEEKISAGPQSKILEGMTWEEAQRIKDGHVSGTSDTMIVVGAASKGIIQRDHQHNAVVYKTYYQPNPFDSMSEEEINKYKDDIEKKSKSSITETTEHREERLVPGPDGKLISTEQRMIQVRHDGQPTETTITTTEGETETEAETEADGEGEVRPRRQYLETSIDDLTDAEHRGEGDKADTPPSPTAAVATKTADSPPSPAVQPADTPTHHLVQGTVTAGPPSPTTPTGGASFQRAASERYTPQRSAELVDELNQNFERSKSERKPKKNKRVTSVNGDDPGSPTKSTSSGDVEGSPTKEATPAQESPSKEKKKKKFRMPSFSKKKDKK